jgi:hypothetical protein
MAQSSRARHIELEKAKEERLNKLCAINKGLKEL